MERKPVPVQATVVTVDEIATPVEHPPSHDSHGSHDGEAKDANEKLTAKPTFSILERTPTLPPFTQSKHLFSPWTLELLATLLFLLTLMAIILTLTPYNHQPLPTWTPVISINSLLSIYTVILRASLFFVAGACVSQHQWTWFRQPRELLDVARYDAAGRGPWGAFLWLWKHHVKSPMTAFGALVVILFVIIDPFVQQLVQFDDCSAVFLAEGASAPRTNVFKPRNGLHNSFSDNFVHPEVQIPVVAALNAGLFAANQQVDISCDTGNCTFAGTYETVGFCSLCEDVSEKITVKRLCVNANTGASLNITLGKNETNQQESRCPGEPGRDWTVNITTSVEDGYSLTYSPLFQRGYPDLFLSDGVVDTNSTMSQSLAAQILMGLTSFADGGVDASTGDPMENCDTDEEKETWRCRGYGAAECTIQPCVRSYQMNIEAGVINETMVEFSDPALGWLRSAIDVQSQFHGLVDLDCVSSKDRINLEDEGYELGGSRWLPYSLTFNATDALPPNAPYPQSLLQQQCLYLTATGFISDLWSEFLLAPADGILTGTVSGNLGIGAIQLLSGPLHLQRMYNFSHADFAAISATYSDIADALTDYVRLNGNENHSAPAVGEMHHYATCLRVEWGWIALPASLIIATVVLFTVTIATTYSGDVPVWKSNPLAFIFHGPGGAGWHGVSRRFPREEVQRLNEGLGMERVAKGIKVKLDTAEPLVVLMDQREH